MNDIIKKNGIYFGLLSGIISIIITTTVYVVNINLFISGWLSFIKAVIFITVPIFLLIKTKKQLNGVLNFKDTFTTYFIYATIGLLIATLFEIVLFNFIDPSIKAPIKELSIKVLKEFLEKFGTPTQQINEAVLKIQENDQFSIFELIKGYFSYLIMSSILGLILSAIFKSKPSERI